MKKERLSLKTSLKIGVISGSIFAILMAAFDYFDDESFSLIKFTVNLLVFGVVMAIVFRYKHTIE